MNDYRRDDNRGYDEDRARRQRDLERYAARKEHPHQTRKPSRGAWYEQQPARQQGNRTRQQGQSQRQAAQRSAHPYDARRTGNAPARTQNRIQRTGNIQNQGRQQRQQLHVPQSTRVQQHPGRPYQVPNAGKAASGRFGQVGNMGASSGNPRMLLIMAAIAAVLALIFIIRIATFSAGAQLSEVNAQLSDAQAQLEQVTTANSETEASIDQRQTTIDEYNKLVQASS